MADQVVDGKVVLFHYTLTDEEGQELDSSENGEPMCYLHGASNIVPGLEEALTGKSAGDSLQVAVPPEKGYGVRQDTDPQPLPINAFPKEVTLEAGMQFFAEGENGTPTPIWIERVEGDSVFIDVNHPLAGETLHFDVKIVRIRDANEDERDHGHPHGPDGTSGHDHHH
jgi:FKBP-type peptidyl-prolyl cis-trans isomerase SlyD